MKVTTDSCLFGAWCAREVQDVKVQGATLLDIGTGTGLLSLMVAQQNNMVIDALEINKEAATQAAENIAASPWKERIAVFNEDVLQWKAEKKYHVILSNPPFYERSLQSDHRAKNTAHHSTELSLEQLISFAKLHLNEAGIFLLLLPYLRLKELQVLAVKQSFFLTKIITVRQTINHAPFRIMAQCSFRQPTGTVINDMAVKDGENGYTQAFTTFLNAYYLYL